MLVIAPLLAVWYQECAEALVDAVATHDEVGQGKVDIAALIEKISHRFVVAEDDNGVEAGAEGEDRAVLLRPLRVGAPGTFLGELVDVAD